MLDTVHAIDRNAKPLCGDGKRGFGDIDALLNKAVTCPACLRLISEAVIDKMRRLGVNLTPESNHHCAASISLKTELEKVKSDFDTRLAEHMRSASGAIQLRRDNARLVAEIEVSKRENTILIDTLMKLSPSPHTDREVLRQLARKMASAPPPEKPPDPPTEDDPAVKRFKLLEID